MSEAKVSTPTLPCDHPSLNNYFAIVVNRLTAIGSRYGHTQQLREHISREIQVIRSEIEQIQSVGEYRGIDNIGVPSTPSFHPKANTRWRHNRTGGEYTVIVVTNSSYGPFERKWTPMVVYEDQENNVWSRNVLEFLKKFSPI